MRCLSLLVLISSLALLSESPPAHAAGVGAPPSGYQKLELRRLEGRSTDGGFPIFNATGKSKLVPDPDAAIELRCVDRAWSGKDYWSYREIFIPVPRGPLYWRKEPELQKKREQGFKFEFESFAECGRGDTATIKPGKECTAVFWVNSKERRIRFAGATCTPLAPDSGLPSRKKKPAVGMAG